MMLSANNASSATQRHQIVLSATVVPWWPLCSTVDWKIGFFFLSKLVFIEDISSIYQIFDSPEKLLSIDYQTEGISKKYQLDFWTEKLVEACQNI